MEKSFAKFIWFDLKDIDNCVEQASLAGLKVLTAVSVIFHATNFIDGGIAAMAICENLAKAGHLFGQRFRFRKC